MDKPVEKTQEQKESIRDEVFDRTLTLMIGGLSLVAALAWNEAVLGIFKQVFPQGGGLIFKFVYAVVVTAIVVVISMRLSRLKPKKPQT